MPFTDSPIEPVVASGVAVFSDSGSIYGLRVSDGLELWREEVGPEIQAMWADSSAVTVLAGAGPSEKLSSFSITSGRTRWVIRQPDSAAAPPELAGNGGLASLAPHGALELISMASGRTSWVNRAASASYPGPQTTNSLVIGGRGKRVGAYHAATGTAAWKVRVTLSGPLLRSIAGLILVTAGLQQRPAPTGITALSSSTGRVVWRLNPGVSVEFQSAGPAGIEMDSFQPARLYLLDRASGRVRWRADTSVELGSTPLITASLVVYVRTTGRLAGQLVARNAIDGAVRWASKPVAGQFSPVTSLGNGIAVVSIWGRAGYVRAFSIATGKTVWQVGLPAAAFAPPPAPLLTSAGILVQAVREPAPCTPSNSSHS